MAATNFTDQQIERFSDRIKNCLDDPKCRPILKTYLQFVKKPMLLTALELWELVNSSSSWDDDTMFDLIYDIDAFNENPLLSIAESQQKLEFTKEECCRILNKILPAFIAFLNRHHRSGTC